MDRFASSKTPNRLQPDNPKPRSILKRRESPSCSSLKETAKPCHLTGAGASIVKSVKFKKSKSVEQTKMRSKLNAWLEAKGKSPDGCRHLGCFDADQSSEKKYKSVLPRLSGDHLRQQGNALKNENSNCIRKSLFQDTKVTGSAHATKTTPTTKKIESSHVGKKQNAPGRRSANFGLTNNENTTQRNNVTKSATLSSRKVDTSSGIKKENRIRRRSCPEIKAFSDKTNSKTTKSPCSMTKIKKRVDEVASPKTSESPIITMPFDSHDPKLADCAIRENLYSMLEECLTLLRAGCPADTILHWLDNMELHIPQAVTCASFYACKAEVLSDNPLKMLEVFCKGVENKAEPRHILSEAMKQLLSPHLASCENPSLTALPPSYQPDLQCNGLSENYRPTSVASDCLKKETIKTLRENPVTGIECTSSSKRKTSLKSDKLSYDHKSPLFLNGGDRISSRHTPVRESSMIENTSNLGSITRYAVTSVAPLPRQSPETMSRTMLTPVRRSKRLSNRLSTPQAVRVIDRMTDLSPREIELSPLLLSNPAIHNE